MEKPKKPEGTKTEDAASEHKADSNFLSLLQQAAAGARARKARSRSNEPKNPCDAQPRIRELPEVQSNKESEINGEGEPSESIQPEPQTTEGPNPWQEAEEEALLMKSNRFIQRINQRISLLKARNALSSPPADSTDPLATSREPCEMPSNEEETLHLEEKERLAERE